MDIISFNESATANGRIENFIKNPDSTSGVVTVPSTIASGETITIPTGRTAILPNVQIDGTLNVDGTVFIPTGTTTSKVIPRVTSIDNAIVRFDGTNGDVQNSSITVDDSGNIGSGTQSFNGFGGAGFKNYIINGKFDVWQRGKSFNIAGGETRCADMFLVYNATTTPTCSIDSGAIGFYNSLKISGANSISNKHIIHRIEAINAISLGIGGNTKITFSLWLNADVNSTVKVAIRVPNTGDTWGSYTTPKISNDIQITTSWNRYSVTFDLDFVYWGGIALDVYTTTAQTSLWTTGWQLEHGPVATPFENRPYGLELSLCQRYLPTAQGFYAGHVATNTEVVLSVKNRVEPRVSPTGILYQLSGTVYYTNNSSIITNISLFAGSIDSNTIKINPTGAPLTIGQGVMVGLPKILFTGCEL